MFKGIQQVSMHTEYKWAGLKDIGKLKMRAGHKDSIKIFFKNIQFKKERF